MGLIAIGLLAGVVWTVYNKTVALSQTLQPWPWPADFRASVEAMARAIDPNPKRLLPQPEKAELVAKVAAAAEELARLIADRPAAWPWAVFTSVLLQRRTAVQGRLRAVASGYQPRPGLPQIDGQSYSQIAYRSMNAIADLVAQFEQFMLSPAFKGAFGEQGSEDSADADAIVEVANRLMDYHEAFLTEAETCLQTPVDREVLVFVQDMGAFALCPLIGYQQFIPTMCARIAEAQDLLPYTTGSGTVQLDDVNLEISLPDGLMERINGQIERFNQ
ncbi:MAG: hypothetical protein ACOYEV_08935 [Candidatus Nanopelagicales bacterium]